MIIISLLLLAIAAWSFSVNILKAILFVILAGAIWIPRKKEQRQIIVPVILITLAITEGLFLLIDYKPYDEVRIQDKHPLPYVMFGYGDLGDLGLRDPQQKSIILLGGSTVYGIGVSEKDTISSQLTEIIDIPVSNWGIPAYNSRQEILLFLQEMKTPPEILITYDGINDLLLPQSYDPRPGYPYNFYSVEAGDRMLRGDASLFDLFGIIAQKTRTGQLLFQEEIRHQFASVDIEQNEDWRKALVDDYRHNLQILCDLSRAYGYQYYAFLQPHLNRKTQLTDAEKTYQVEEAYNEHAALVYDLAKTMYSDLQSNNPDCHFVDMSDFLQDETDKLFNDIWHLNAEGNTLIAQGIASELTISK